MNSTKRRGRPKGSFSSALNKDPEHWFAVGSEVLRRVRIEGKRKTTERIIDDLASELRRDGHKHWSHRSIERAYGDYCELFPGSTPGARPSSATWAEVITKLKVNPDKARAIFSSTGKIGPETFRALLLPGTEPSPEYSTRNMFKKRKTRRPVGIKRDKPI